MKCPWCDGKGEFLNTRKQMITCPACLGTGEKEQTNRAWLDAMDDEQFADWLTDTFDLCGAGCSNCFVSKKCLSDDCNEMPTELIVDWLKEVHHE